MWQRVLAVIVTTLLRRHRVVSTMDIVHPGMLIQLQLSQFFLWDLMVVGGLFLVYSYFNRKSNQLIIVKFCMLAL